jgi:hypothetical protein
MAFAQHTHGGGPGIARLARWGGTRVHPLPTGTGRPCSDPLVLFPFTRTVPSPPRALYAEPCVWPARIVRHRDSQEIGGCVMAKQHGLPAGQPLTRPAFLHLLLHLWGSAVLASGCAGLANVNHSIPTRRTVSTPATSQIIVERSTTNRPLNSFSQSFVSPPRIARKASTKAEKGKRPLCEGLRYL